jgi:hypothetical protein
MKKTVVTLILVLGLVFFAKAQSSINDYKYVVVPHFYEFIKGKDAYRLNTITRFLLRKKGLNAFMQEEIKEKDYKSNNCLALKANVLSINSMLKTKLKVVLKNCDGDIIFESKIGESKVKEYNIAYKEALNKAFESFDVINYHYTPNKDIISRADDDTSKAEVTAAKVEVEKLKAELKELKEEKDKAVIVRKKEEVSEHPSLEAVRNDSETESYLKAKSITNGYELINNTNKIEYIIQKTGMKDVYTIKDQKGIIYKKGKDWIREYVDGNKTVKEILDIRF